LGWARMGAERGGVCGSSCSGGGGGNDPPCALAGRGRGTGEDAPMRMGLGLRVRRVVCSSVVVCGAEGLIYPPPPPPTALGETRLLEDEDVSERTDGERVYVEGAGASPPSPRSAPGISIGREPLAFPLPLLSTLAVSWRSRSRSLTSTFRLNSA
jgi:hypothetical protein